MRNILLFSVFLSAFCLTAQDTIPYRLDLFNTYREAIKVVNLEGVVDEPGANGQYFVHGDYGDPGYVSYFDGQDFRTLYSPEEEIEVIGTTPRGIYIMEDITPYWKYRLLFIDRTNGKVDTLRRSELDGPAVRQLDDDVLVAITDSLILYSADGSQLVLYTSSCSCRPFDDYVATDEYVLAYGDAGYVLTDGTTGGTRRIGDFGWWDEPYVHNGVFYITDPYGIRAVDIGTGTIHRVDTQPGGSERLQSINSHTWTPSGLLYTATSDAAGRELYLTDGSPGGPVALPEINLGPTNGVGRYTHSSYPMAYTVGDYLIFRRGEEPGRENEYWISDGTAAGTHFLFDPADYGVRAETRIAGVQLTGGNLMLRAEHDAPDSDSMLVMSYDPSTRQPPVAVGYIPYGRHDYTMHALGERMVLEGRGSDLPLLTFGVTSGDVQNAGILREDSKLLYADDEVRFYHSEYSRDSSAVYATRGMEGDLTKVLKTEYFYAGGSKEAAVFRNGTGLYLYAYHGPRGETIYRVDPTTYATEFVADAFAFSRGSHIKALRAIRDRVYWTDANGETYLISSPTDSTTAFPSGGFLEQDVLGTHGDYHYTFHWQVGNGGIMRTHLDSGTVDRIKSPLWEIPGANYGAPVLLGGKLYRIRKIRDYSMGVSFSVRDLLVTDLASMETTVLSSDTVGGRYIGGETELTTDDRLLYFMKNQGGNEMLASYEPVSGAVRIITDVNAERLQYIIGSVQSRTTWLKFYVPNIGTLLQGVTDGRAGPVFPIDYYFTTPMDLGGGAVAIAGYGKVQFVDPRTGEVSTLMSFEGSNNISRLTRLRDGQGAVFFGREADDVWRMYFTDGTREGTRRVKGYELHHQAEYYGYSAFPVGDYLAVAYNTDQLHLVDPRRDKWQTVGDLHFGRGYDAFSGYALTNDRAYFGAVDPIHGHELHVLSPGKPATVNGFVYDDRNGNGRQDDAEAGLPRIPLIVGAPGYRVYTDDAGYFQISIGEGERLSVLPSAGDCRELSSLPQRYTVTKDDTATVLSFGLRPSEGESVLRAQLQSGVTRCNFPVPYWLSIHNTGCSTSGKGTALVHLPENVTFISSADSFAVVDDRTLAFPFDSLVPEQSLRISLQLKMPDETFTGEEVRVASSISVSRAVGEAVDTVFASDILRCAVDPNDKQVWPRRQEATNSNYTQRDETLRYTVRFQNTGNDTAFTLRIEDRLDEGLDWNTFRPIAASHPYLSKLTDGGYLIFLFDNIMLPDSVVDLPGSQGFVTFEIGVDSTLADFTAIENTAAIYFDYNAPVITNTVVSTIVEVLDGDRDGSNFYADCNDQDPSISPKATEIPGNGTDEDCDGVDGSLSVRTALEGQLTVFPNPASDWIKVTYSRDDALTLELLDISGRSYHRSTFRATYRIPTSTLPAGVYLLCVRDLASGALSQQRVVIQ